MFRFQCRANNLIFFRSPRQTRKRICPSDSRQILLHISSPTTGLPQMLAKCGSGRRCRGVTTMQFSLKTTSCKTNMLSALDAGTRSSQVPMYLTATRLSFSKINHGFVLRRDRAKLLYMSQTSNLLTEFVLLGSNSLSAGLSCSAGAFQLL